MLSRKLALLAGLTSALFPMTAAMAQAPVRPTMPDLQAIDPAICDDPVRRASLIAGLQDAMEIAMGRADIGAAYAESLIAWRGSQLVRSGRWTSAQRETFQRQLANAPEIRRSAEAAQAVMRDALQTIAAQASGVDQAVAECQALIVVRDFEIRLIPHIEAQWRAIDAVYAAEALRLGVSLD